MLTPFTKNQIDSFINKREGEIKLGETISTIYTPENVYKEIKQSTASFIIIGILKTLV